MKIIAIKLLFVFLLLEQTLIAQVGIGTTTPAASSILEISSTTKGLLIPRMTQAQKNAISSPATGLQIYQTDGSTGYWYYTGVAWTQLSALAGTAGGDLSGTYPNPTVANINGVALGTTTATSGNMLIGSGTQWVTKAISGDATISAIGVVTLSNNATARTNIGLGTAHSPTFTGLTLSGLSTAGIVTNTAGGVLGTSATIPASNLGSGTTNSTTVLRGDGTWVSSNSLGYRTLVNKGSDQNINSTAWVDISNLSFSVTSGTTYHFQAIVVYSANAITDGINFSVNGPTITLLAYQVHQPNGVSTEYTYNSVAYDNAPVAVSNSAYTSGNVAIITGAFTPSANGTFTLRCSEEAANKHIVKASSCIEYW